MKKTLKNSNNVGLFEGCDVSLSLLNGHQVHCQRSDSSSMSKGGHTIDLERCECGALRYPVASIAIFQLYGEKKSNAED